MTALPGYYCSMECCPNSVCSCVVNSSSLNKPKPYNIGVILCGISWIQFEMLPCCAGLTGGGNIENGKEKGNKRGLHW